MANDDYEIALRGVVIVKNMVTVGGAETAEKILATEIMEVIQALICKAQRKSFIAYDICRHFPS